jgi:hypothetical protein
VSAAGYTKLLTENVSYKLSTTSYHTAMFSLSRVNPKQVSKLKSAPQIGRERLSYHGTKHSTTLKFQKKTHSDYIEKLFSAAGLVLGGTR